uniref:Uncharacterized protein n=1 Tax=Acrobeloides nanus TaxID=290746 RepID=A0A914CRT3_9BILA
MRKFFGSSGSSNVTNKENQQKPKEKDAEKSARDKESQMEKRPGSAISQDFMPKKQQKAIKEWKKHEEQNKAQRPPTINPYGYVPFKTAPMPIYGTRMAPNEANYMHSTYAPPQAIRPESAMTQDMASQNMSRPGSDMGLYLSSRYQSYTTLPRPEHIEMDSSVNPSVHKENIYGSANSNPNTPKLNNRVAPLQEKTQIYGVREPIKGLNRAGSVTSESRSVQTANFLPYPTSGKGHYGSLGITAIEDESKAIKELVNWNSLSLCCSMQVLCGLCIFALGVSRLFLRAEYAKGQELFYGISVMCAGLLGVFAARHRSYCAAVSSFVHSTINAVLAAVPFLSGLLPILPFAYQKQPHVSFSSTDEPLEVDFALALLSVGQFVLAVITSIIGCRSAGHTLHQIETLRIQKILEKRHFPIREKNSLYII